ncbi:LysM peptidoglycan-binding domain-containing protein [Paenibacillus sp. HN-1]|uniref:LysM peptidoglycan-binding domain-containing protein n=1 Tax=Paenibacillus TaxID=44249 RepID=UPI001CA97AF6|nr:MULTISPECIES: LysM peptidoglycan-binding domain-containing protein [Paenibacillus]MBY9080992.1 LysM peptidoglycan-binding domain-containing protein [Paenibacillus sp. CGMCC 1.18879]MBY9084094.1 LysM peptidoglycan-binding domain-containing protein [Paenibacillus sinensis]
MELHLIDGAGKSFVFPVNPEEITINRGKGFETVNILRFGDFDYPSGEKVKEIAFSSFFPKNYDSYCVTKKLMHPQNAVNVLTKMMVSKQPVRFIVTGTYINVLVIVSVHNSTYRGGEPEDVYFDITLRTWREPRVHTKLGSSKSANTTTNKAATSRPDTKKTAKTYTVKIGDSLSKIAKLELGNSSKWQAIYNLNKKVIGPDPNKIYPGQKLVMPT